MNEDHALLRADDATWEQALKLVEHDIYQVPQFSVLDAALTGGTAVAFYFRSNSHILLLPLVLRPIEGTEALDATSPYGYSGPVSNADPNDTDFWYLACQSLLETLASEQVATAFIRLHPLLPAPLDVFRSFGSVVEHGLTVSIDLSLSGEEIWRRTRRDHRKQIRQIRTRDRKVVFDDWSYFDEWMEAYYDNMRRVGASDFYFFSRDHFQGLRERLKEHVHLVVVLVEDTVGAGDLFFRYGGFVESYLGGMRTAYRGEHLDKLLYDEVRRWAQDQGAAVYHIGGGRGGASDQLYNYKAGFSDRRHPFHTWRLVPSPDANQQLVNQLTPGEDAENRTGYFPVYRRAHG